MKLYHADNFGTTKLDPKKMNMGNNQEGIGIYFADKLSFTKFYGNKMISIDVNPKNFVGSREPFEKQLPLNKLLKVFLDMWKIDEEAMYYLITDWGIEISESNEITVDYIKEMIKLMYGTEVRNLQITLANAFGVVNFVKSWNKHMPEIHGTVNKSREIWCVINTNYKIKKLNW